jgi:hypothetical protein
MRRKQRRKLQSASRRYTTALAAEVGQPSPQERATAIALAQRIARRTAQKRTPDDEVIHARGEREPFPGGTVVTSDPDDLKALAAHAEDIKVEAI